MSPVARSRRTGQADLPGGGEQDRRGVGVDAEALGGRGARPGGRRALDAASAAQARVIARMRERGYSVEAIREAARGGRLAFGYAEDLFQVPEGHYTREQAAETTGLEPRADRAPDDAARHADGRRGKAQRGGPESDAPLRRRPRSPASHWSRSSSWSGSTPSRSARSPTPRFASSTSTSTSR